MDKDTKAEKKEIIKNTGKDLKDVSKLDPSTNVHPKSNGKKGVSFEESNISSKEHLQDDVAIEVENSTKIPMRKLSEGNPSTYRSSDEDDDAFTVLFLLFAWILIILTFPISIFSCFKMVQVKCKIVFRHIIH